jgi:threonine synthase
VIEAYRDRLPVAAAPGSVTLLEGGTPLLPAPTLSARTGCDVWLKVEGLNPTGSFKDRGMTVAITQAVAAGRRRSSARAPATPARPPRRTRCAAG